MASHPARAPTRTELIPIRIQPPRGLPMRLLPKPAPRGQIYARVKSVKSTLK